MTEAIIVALITGGLTLAGTIISLVSVNSKTLYRISLLEKNLEKLELRYDQINAIMEKIFLIEKNIAVLSEKVEELEDGQPSK